MKKQFNTEQTESSDDQEIAIDLMSLLGGEDSQSPTWSSTELLHFGRESRTLILLGEVNERKSIALASQIKELNTESDEPIILYIHSEGGGIYDGMFIYDSIQASKAPVVTVVAGMAASAGLLIAAAGDIRMCYPNSTFFYHQPIFSNHQTVSPEEMESLKNQYLLLKGKLDSLMKSKMKISKSDWNKHFGNSTSKYFDSQEALSWGVVHHVIERSKKRKLSVEEAVGYLHAKKIPAGD